MVPGRPSLGEILLRQGVISGKQLDEAIQHQITRGCLLGEALVELRVCTDVEIAQALAAQYEIPFVNLNQTPPLPSFVALLSREVAIEYQVIPVRMEGSRLLVAALDPMDIRADEAVYRATGLRATFAVAPDSQLKEVLREYYSINPFEEEITQVLEPGLGGPWDGPAGQHSVDAVLAAGRQHSVVRMVDALISDAIRRGASDIHVEPEEDRIRVRYRLDGRMRNIVALPRVVLQNVVARIKIMCGMDISENRKAQDGSVRLQVEARQLELRVSTLPGIYGEVVVIRILNHDLGLQRLEKLGFAPDTYHSLHQLLSLTHGLILMAGPTGSGKTTSVYAALNHLNTEELNVITVEDPVEIKLEGINQIQVHERAGRSFADTLRAMLRQDPDVIMVGEIRDLETAEIACRAALTGHLVLSTLHAQDSLGLISRMLEMGVPPFIVTAALNGVLAQRLVRRVCPLCAEEYIPPPELAEVFESLYGDISDAQFRRGVGCGACLGTGARGRMGVYELLLVDDDLRERLAEDTPPSAMREYLRNQGLRTIEEDAFQKAREGLIAPVEVIGLGMALSMRMEALGLDPLDIIRGLEPAPDSPRLDPLRQWMDIFPDIPELATLYPGR